MRLVRKKIIYGCESRGDAQSPYLTRWTLLSTELGAVYLHKFHRSDADEHHDHPWAFVSLILWRGYIEETICPACEGSSWGDDGTGRRCRTCHGYPLFFKRVWPGMILFRRATHRHRVELIGGKPAWTLIIRGPYVRPWGFFTRKGWQEWREYFEERGCE
jgi:hypothetical protein